MQHVVLPVPTAPKIAIPVNNPGQESQAIEGLPRAQVSLLGGFRRPRRIARRASQALGTWEAGFLQIVSSDEQGRYRARIGWLKTR